MCDEDASRCGRFGRCVFSAATANTAAGSLGSLGNESWTCECDEWWTGKSDILSFDGYGCMVPVPVEVGLWSLVLLTSIVLFLRHVKALRCQMPVFRKVQQRAAKTGRHVRFFEWPTFQVISVGFLGPICMAVLAVPKVAGLDSREIGRGWVVSVAFAVLIPAGFCANVVSEIQTYDTLVRGVTSVTPTEARRMRHFMKWRYWSATAAYSIATACTALYGCTLDEMDPEESPMRVLLVLRNASVSLFFLVFFLTGRAIVKHAQGQLKDMGSGPGDASLAVKASSARIRQLLSFLQEGLQEKKKLARASFVAYLIFALPPLWPYQSFVTAIVVIKAGLSRGHPINSYTRTRSRHASVASHPKSLLKGGRTSASTVQVAVEGSAPPLSMHSSSLKRPPGGTAPPSSLAPPTK